MAFIALIALAVLIGLFFLLRAMGALGQRPSPRERARHSAEDVRPTHPRASGLD